MRLRQDQVWKQGDQYFRIVRLERLTVEYKEQKNIHLRDGYHRHVTKKEFCRLIKGATLVPLEIP